MKTQSTDLTWRNSFMRRVGYGKNEPVFDVIERRFDTPGIVITRAEWEELKSEIEAIRTENSRLKALAENCDEEWKRLLAAREDIRNR